MITYVLFQGGCGGGGNNGGQSSCATNSDVVAVAADDDDDDEEEEEEEGREDFVSGLCLDLIIELTLFPSHSQKHTHSCSLI